MWRISDRSWSAIRLAIRKTGTHYSFLHLHTPFLNADVDEKAKQRIFDDPNWDHDYPPSHLGEQQFRDASVRLLFGADSDIVSEERYARSTFLTDMGTHTAEMDTNK